MFKRGKRKFGDGCNEFIVEAKRKNGSDCCVYSAPITIMTNGCHCDVLNLLSRSLQEFEMNHPELFSEATNKNYLDGLSEKFWKIPENN